MRMPAMSKGARRAGRRGAGYTLTEVLVALAIAGILMAVGIPSFNQAILNGRLTSYSNEFVATVMLARAEAINRNTVVTMCPSSDGANCSGANEWQQGYIVTCAQSSATPGNCNVAPGVASAEPLVLATRSSLATGFKMTEASGLTAITFRPTGLEATSATWTMCRNAPLGTRERVIRIGGTGRASVTKTETGVCA